MKPFNKFSTQSISCLILIVLCANAQGSCVILLHGLLRTPASLETLEENLSREGYTTVNLGYPSRHYPIEVLAKEAIEPALTKCPPGDEIYFVTHSLGGILVRQYLNKHTIKHLKRVVMLGPPNLGSEVVDSFGRFYGFKWINGPAGLQLGTGILSVPNKLGRVNFELAVIAGNRSINWILSSVIPGPDDGKVSVERTKIEGMNAHITLPVNHAMMMNNPQVIANVISYLKHGTWSEVK